MEPVALAVGDMVTLADDEAFVPAEVAYIFGAGDAVVIIPSRSRTHCIIDARGEGTRWARGIGDDARATLLLTRSTM